VHQRCTFGFLLRKNKEANPLLTIEHSASKMHIWIFVSQKQGGKSSPHHKVRIFASQKQGGCYEV